MILGFWDWVLFIGSNATIVGVLNKWLELRLEKSIQHEYDKKLEAVRHEYERRMEDYRNNVRIREQAARVVDLLVHAHYSTTPDPAEFNRLAWELSLWLPADLVWELTQMLCGASKKDPKDILVAVRRILLQDPNDKLEPGQIVHMPRPAPPTSASPGAITQAPVPPKSLGASGTG